MLAEGAGGLFLSVGRVTFGSGAASRIEVVTLGGGIAGTGWVVGGIEGALLLVLGFEAGLTDRFLAGVLAVDSLGTLLECPRVMRVYSASIPLLSYEICIGRLPREYLAVICVRMVSAWLMIARKSLTKMPI
jgi:hypothetical protein